MSRWYRAYVGTVSDDKIAEVALIAACSHCVAVAVWHALLESAAADQAGGAFSTTPRRVAATLRERCETVENVFAAMAELKMLADGAICAWAKFNGDDGRLSPEIWASVRAKVFERDGFKCQYCGEFARRLECDHEIPVSRGGTNDMDNLKTACLPCNRSKGSKLLSEWLK